MRRRRWKSRVEKKGSRKKYFFIALLIFTIMTIQSFMFIDKHLKEPLMNIAKFRIKQIATVSINKAITEKIAEEHQSDKLMDWKTDRNGNVTGFMLNYMEHLKITAETVDVVQKTLDELSKTPDHIPIGQALGSPILASYGPNIKIKFIPEGSVKVDLNTREKNVGINNTLVEVYIRVITEVAIHIPFETGIEMVDTEIPISYMLVVGDVPMYYFDNKGQPIGTAPGSSGVIPPTISLPNVDHLHAEEDGSRRR